MVLPNVTMGQSNMREKKKIRVPPNVTKVRSEVMLVLNNVRIEPSNVRKKIKESLNVTRTVTCDVGIAECEDETVKCEKKNKGTTKCDKRTVTCDVGTA